MNTFLYIIVFITGTFFGSFYTLAVYRVPRGIDIIKKHSYCPNCNSKLGFFELFPVISYIILGGKCKHCGQKIRIRYLILEVLSGLLFVIFAFSLRMNINTLDIHFLIQFMFFALYITAIILIAGIDKEFKKINKNLLAYGVIISLFYMIYLYTIGETSIYRYAIYLVIFLMILLVDTFILRNKAEDNYIINVLMLLMIIYVNTSTKIFLFTIGIALLSIILYIMLREITVAENRKLKEEDKKMPLGYFICVSNIIAYLLVNILINYF